MNESIKEQAEAALQTIIQDAVSIREFAIEQAPDIIRELVWYNTFMAWASVVLCSAVFTVCLVAILAGLQEMPKYCTKPREDFADVSVVFATCIGGVSFIGLVCTLPDAIKITFATKLWLVEYAAELIK